MDFILTSFSALWAPKGNGPPTQGIGVGLIFHVFIIYFKLLLIFSIIVHTIF